MTTVILASVLVSLVNLSLWVDYLIYTVQVHRAQHGTRYEASTQRVMVFAWMMVLTVALAGTGFAVSLASEHPVFVNLLLAAAWRAAALIVGAWIAWDRRHHPYPGIGGE